MLADQRASYGTGTVRSGRHADTHQSSYSPDRYRPRNGLQTYEPARERLSASGEAHRQQCAWGSGRLGISRNFELDTGAYRGPRPGGGMTNRVANKAILQPFSVLRKVGFSSRWMQRFERHRTQQKRLNRVVLVMRWADGTWCALSVPNEAPRPVIVDEGQQIDAYEDARSCLDGDFLPLLSLRWEANA